MKVDVIKNFPLIYTNIYNVVKKSGSRIEYSLTLNNSLHYIASQITSIPLKFASIVLALPGTNDQKMHFDSTNGGERAIIYLTDVNKETNGPIEFQEYGKVLGKAGTFVHYNADEMHRGCKSDIHRYALALAFHENNNVVIDTIGGPLNQILTNCVMTSPLEATCEVQNQRFDGINTNGENFALFGSRERLLFDNFIPGLGATFKYNGVTVENGDCSTLQTSIDNLDTITNPCYARFQEGTTISILLDQEEPDGFSIYNFYTNAAGDEFETVSVEPVLPYGVGSVGTATKKYWNALSITLTAVLSVILILSIMFNSKKKFYFSL